MLYLLNGDDGLDSGGAEKLTNYKTVGNVSDTSDFFKNNETDVNLT